MSGNRKLREALDAASSLTDWNVYLDTLESCRTQFDHGITVLPDGKGRLRRFNCYAYALGLWDHADYISAVDRSTNSAIVDTPFVKSMVQSGLLVKRSSPQPCAGDVAVYYHYGQPTHAALVVSVDDAIWFQSKWGGNEVHRHGLWEVPAMYGDVVRFFRQPKPSDTLNVLHSRQVDHG
jgi:hypothetical protein